MPFLIKEKAVVGRNRRIKIVEEVEKGSTDHSTANANFSTSHERYAGPRHSISLNDKLCPPAETTLYY